MGQSELERDELLALEALVIEALEARDDSALNVLGYGEVSVALGWPVEEPRFVCKRTPPFTRQQFDAYEALVNEYLERVAAAGLSVVDTSIVSLAQTTPARNDRDGNGADNGEAAVAYLVQPMLDASTLGQNVLKATEPDPDHPFLVAVASALDVVTPTLSIDAQVTNFGWDGERLTLIDVGTPFLWDEAGDLRFDMTPFARMLPAPTRPLAVKELTKLVSRWNDPRRVGVDIVANLFREGLPEWVDATVIALNRQLDENEPITADEGRELYEEDLKIWPALKRVQTVERWWQTTVRRRRYDWFIYSSYE